MYLSNYALRLEANPNLKIKEKKNLYNGLEKKSPLPDFIIITFNEVSIV